MNEKQLIETILAETGMNKIMLGEKAGYNSKSAITEILNRKGMKVDILLKLLNAMDCELVVRNKDGKEWVINNE